jgi:hypothetical protein
MHEELNNFKRNEVWSLVERPKSYSHVEGLDFDETFAPVARLGSKSYVTFLCYSPWF